LREDISRSAQGSLIPDPLERSDREIEIESFLEELGYENAYEYASSLVMYGWTVPDLTAWCAPFTKEQMSVIIRWLAIGYRVDSLLGEISDGTGRITEIVSAVKDYAYLDQAPLKKINIHTGLESTLVMLQYKLKQGISIQRNYDPELPELDVYGSELNQVWSNLIDNAIEAMHGEGELRLRTYREGGQAVVEIGDDGPGIPENVLPRLFEPFFTTKDPGQGTGLGLYVSYNIIQKHHGVIEVTSKPGDTRFIVRLPLR